MCLACVGCLLIFGGGALPVVVCHLRRFDASFACCSPSLAAGVRVIAKLDRVDFRGRGATTHTAGSSLEKSAKACAEATSFAA